jgi:hypothetical protein
LIHVSCRNCGTYDIVGPGHPGAVCNHPPDVECTAEEAQHVLTDRTALRHNHAADCQPDPETGHYPLHFDFMAGTGASPPAAVMTGA